MNRDDGPALTCSFCEKTQQEVRKLIAGPTHYYICDECIKVGFGIIRGEITKEEPPRGRAVQFAPSAHAYLVAGAQAFADSCDRAVELPRPVAERARALAEELEELASSKTGSRGVFTEYALGLITMARSFATACDALELPGDIAKRARTLADEIKALFPPSVSP